MICDYYIHRTDLADLSSFRKKREISFKFRIREFTGQLEQTKFPVFSKISKFPGFSLTGIYFGHFPGFPCAVVTVSWLKGVQEVHKCPTCDGFGNLKLCDCIGNEDNLKQSA